MPKGSRHKSSKHGSKDARDYSDSEKDSSMKEKERKLKEESSSRVYKESGSVEKRKLDSKDTSKDLLGPGNGEYLVEYSSSKRRKERFDDGVSDRWNGGEDDSRGEKKSKVSSESKSKRREELEGDDLKRSKSEGKNRDSSRREERERERDRERERERKSKEGKVERFIDEEEYPAAKQAAEKAELGAPDQLQSPESESQLERRARKKKDGPGDGYKYPEDNGDLHDRQLSLRNDVGRDGRPKDDKYKDEKYRDRYREDIDREERYRDDKLRDERLARDHTNSRSTDKHSRVDKESTEIRQKKSKTQDNCDREHDCDKERDRDRERERERDCKIDIVHDRDRDRRRDRDYYRECERNRDRDYDRDCERDLEYDHDWDRDLELDRDRYDDRDRRENDRDRDHDRDRDVDYDCDGYFLDDRNARHKDSKGRKRSSDDYVDIDDNKARGVKTQFSDLENKSFSSRRVESDADRGRSVSRQAHPEVVVGGNKRRTSPSSSSHVGTDDFRLVKQEDIKYKEPVTEQRSKGASREVTGFSGSSDRGYKYRTMEKSSKIDDGDLGELPIERSSSSKASPTSFIERSPSSTSLDHRYTRAGGRRSLEVEETGWRGSVSVEDRTTRELPSEKPLLDEPSQDSAFYNSKSNSSLIHPPPGFRPGHGSPSLMGSMEEENRINLSSRFNRSVDPILGRGQGNAWRGTPNWAAPVSTGFIPFQHGPPHGGFQAMMPPFPSPTLFGVRPSMDINHSGIPYHIPDAERFSGHMRPIGWPNMMDGSGPSHLHGWDGNNVFRDEPHMYGGPEWDQNRHPMNGRGWDANSEVWKGQNGDADLSSTFRKEDNPVQDLFFSDGQDGQKCLSENNQNGVQAENEEIGSNISLPAKEYSKSPPKISHERTYYSSKISSDDNSAHFCPVYLSKLDISTELAGSELFGQCMSLFDGEKSEPSVKDAALLVNLKDGGRAVVKASIALLNPSLIPPANNFIFKKALDLYKRQRLEMSGLAPVNSQVLDFDSASNQKQQEEKVSFQNLEKTLELATISNAEMPDAATLNSDEEKFRAFSPIASQENVMVLPSVQGEESQDHAESPSEEKLELPNPDIINESAPELKLALNGDKMDEVKSEQMILEDANGGDSAFQAAVLLTDGENPNNIDKTEDDSSFNCPKERQAFDDAITGSLFLSGGSPKVSGVLMPGSNESESVILSRIHHSPESTH